MNNCSRCINFDGALFKDTPYAQDTCRVTGGVVKNIIENCSKFKDRGKVPWSSDIKETYEIKNGETYKTILRLTDGEQIRLKAVKDDWVEVNQDGVPVFTSIDNEDGLSRAEICQHRANLLATIEWYFKNRKSKKIKNVKDTVMELI